MTRRLVLLLAAGVLLVGAAALAPAWLLPGDDALAGDPVVPHPDPRRVSLRQAAAARERLAVRAAALDVALRPFAADAALRTPFRRAEIELRLAAAALARRDAPAAAAALERAETDLAKAQKGLAVRMARLRDPRRLRRWQEWADGAMAASRRGGGAAVVVDKLGRRCVLFEGGRATAVFRAELGSNPLADKLYAGDAATPEGVYRVIEKKDAGATRFHRALLLDYPTAEDRREYAEARRRGFVPRGRGIGGLIEIHGHGGRGSDWTNGCVALRNADMDRLFARLPLGAPVAIVGTADLPLAEVDRRTSPEGAAHPRPGEQGEERGDDRDADDGARFGTEEDVGDVAGEVHQEHAHSESVAPAPAAPEAGGGARRRRPGRERSRDGASLSDFTEPGRAIGLSRLLRQLERPW